MRQAEFMDLDSQIVVDVEEIEMIQNVCLI